LKRNRPATALVGVLDDVTAGPAWRRHLLVLLAFLLLAAPVVAGAAASHTRLSLFDEWQYADRVHRVMQGDLFLREGERMTEWGGTRLACRGIERVQPPDPATCRSGLDGKPPFNWAAADPPTYFVATGVVAWLLRATGLVGDDVLAGRLVGVLWAALGMWSVLLLARAVGASRPAAVLAGLAPLLVPAMAQQYTYLTPHALDVPVGAFAALAMLRWMRREWPWWTLVLAGAGVAGAKGTNVTVVVALAVMAAAILVWPREISRAARVRAVVGSAWLVGASGVFTGVWVLLVRALATGSYDPPGDYDTDRLPLLNLAHDSTRWLTLFSEVPLAAPGTWFVMAMTGAALAVWAGLPTGLPPYVRQLAPGYLLGSALAAVVLDVLVFVSSGQYFGVQVRYGLALFPLGIALAALLLRTRTALGLAAFVLLLHTIVPLWANLDGVTF
jgi:hypothetical protein